MPQRSVHTFCADDGLEVRVRPLTPADAPYLLDIFKHMTPESRYLRFNQPLRDPDPEWLRTQAQRFAYRITARGYGWIAFADLSGERDTPLGGIQFVPVSPEEAEVSLAVRDDFQGNGIGTNLLQLAGREAYARGIKRLIGVVQSTNVALWHSIKRLDIPTTRHRDGMLTVIEVALDATGLQGATDPADTQITN